MITGIVCAISGWTNSNQEVEMQKAKRREMILRLRDLSEDPSATATEREAALERLKIIEGSSKRGFKMLNIAQRSSSDNALPELDQDLSNRSVSVRKLLMWQVLFATIIDYTIIQIMGKNGTNALVFLAIALIVNFWVVRHDQKEIGAGFMQNEEDRAVIFFWFYALPAIFVLIYIRYS